MTPMKAIRAKCLDCCCGQQAEVRECPAGDCPLHRYRFGKNPSRADKGGNAAALAKARLSRESLTHGAI